MFQPQLPTATVEAIERLGFGIVDKVFVDFGAASEASPDAKHQHFCNYGPAGGSNADQSKSSQQNNGGAGQNAVAASEASPDDSMQPLTAKDALSYYLLWNRDPKELQPKNSVRLDCEESKAFSEHVSRDPLSDIKGMSININAMQEDYQEGSPAAKGAGDKAPETHVVTGPQHPTRQGSSSSATADDRSQASTTGRRHDLPAWAHGAYTIRFAGSEFVQDASSDALAAANRCGVVWITGEDAQNMEATSDVKLQKNVAAILQEFPALALPDQFKVYRSKWGSDPLFRGSYSYGSAAATGGECLALSQPLAAHLDSCSDKDLRLLFAGEACHPNYFGCTHGAYLTGQSQARRLMKSWTDSCGK